MNQAEAFFNHLYAGYQAAAQASGSAAESLYRIGGKRVRIGYASQACVQTFAPALAHLCNGSDAISDLATDFTILVWDCVSTGAPVLNAPWSLADYLPSRMVRGYCDERFRTITFHDQAVCLMIDQQARVGIYWRQNIAEVSAHERAAPFRELFCWWMITQQRFFVHGGAIDGVFLAGVGGVGKSTTALACLAQGLAWAGEDYVLLATDEEACAYSLYCTAKLSEFSLRLLPRYRTSVMIPPTEESGKAILNLYPCYAEKIVSQVPLRAVVLPTVGEQSQSRLVPISGATVFRPLFSSTLMQLPSADPALLHGMANVLRKLPCYRLEIGRDLGQLVDCLRMVGLTYA